MVESVRSRGTVVAADPSTAERRDTARLVTVTVSEVLCLLGSMYGGRQQTSLRPADRCRCRGARRRRSGSRTDLGDPVQR